MSVVKLRGLPWSCTAEQIIKFLNGINIVNKSDSQPKSEQSIPGGAAITTKCEDEVKPAVYLTTNAEGRPSGEAFVEVSTEDDLNEALKLNNNLMGQRYIEIFRSDPQQLRQHTQESNTNATNWNDPVLRLRGLPYGCTKQDIETFFQGLVIAFDGVMMVIDFTGRFNGEAFVQFETISDAHKALERHKQKIQNRYIEIFRSNSDEMSYYARNIQESNDNAGGAVRNNNSSYSSRRDSRSDSSMFFNDNQGNQGGNNRFKPYARNGNATGGNRNRGGSGNGGSGGPTPLMGGGFGNNNRGFNNSNNNFNNNNFSDNNFDDNGNYYDDNNNNNNNYDDYGGDNNNGNDQGSTFSLKMRGLPFKVTEREINEFFQPTRPTNINFLSDSKNRGRPSGECECEFDSEENLLEAMKCDKKHIGTRYIELFNLSDNNSRGGGGGGGYNNGGNRGGNSNGSGRGGGNNSRGNSNNNNRGRSSNNGAQANNSTVSLDNFMSQSFNGTNGGQNKTRTPPPPPPVPPPMLPQMQMGHMGMMMMPGQQAQAGMNNFMMTDMAQKMFTAAYSQFQQQQQQLQYGQFNTK